MKMSGKIISRPVTIDQIKVPVRPFTEVLNINGQLFIPIRGVGGFIQSFIEFRPLLVKPVTCDASTQTNEVPLIDLTEEVELKNEPSNWTDYFDPRMGDSSKVVEILEEGRKY